MSQKLFLVAGLFLALTAGSFAQGPSYSNRTSLNAVDDVKRPRRVETAAGVKASVVINAQAVERAAFELINQKRANNGLKPLAWSDELASIARLHSHNMAEQRFFSHRGLDDKLVSDRADDIGLKRWRAIGENIAFERGYQDPTEKAVQLWLDSPSHRQNLMNDDWRESAVGVAVAADGSYYFTQVFLKR
jgi:uncharacterized protein YkwD